MDYTPHPIPLRLSSEKHYTRALPEIIQELMSQWYTTAKAQIYLCANSGCTVHVHPHLFFDMKITLFLTIKNVSLYKEGIG